MEITLIRNRFNDQRTTGQLYIEGELFCFTLEDRVRADPKPETPQNEGKVHGQTAIPEGRYKITFETSKRFGADTITINNVPGFTGVRIHSGNTEHDTEGCPIVGYQLDGNGTVRYGTTRNCLSDLKLRLKPIVSKEDVWLTIKSQK